MWRSYFTEKKWLLWSWGGFTFIILSLLAQTYIDVKINEWYKGFYDLLQKAPERELSEFYDGIILFMKLAIRPRKIPMGETQAITSSIKSAEIPLFFENKYVPIIIPNNAP